jgi:hypothetical protein
LVLLLRLDHLQAGSRADAFNRATLEVHCNWRTLWAEDRGESGRWSSHWISWLNQARRAPLYLREKLMPADAVRSGLPGAEIEVTPERCLDDALRLNSRASPRAAPVS